MNIQGWRPVRDKEDRLTGFIPPDSYSLAMPHVLTADILREMLRLIEHQQAAPR